MQREELPRSALVIDFTQPTIVNFVRLNKLYNSTYTLASHSGPTQSFVLLSELDLLDIFWKNKALKERVMDIFGMSTASKDMAAARLSTNGPGFLLNQLVTRKGTGGQRRGFGSYQKSAKTFSIEDMQDHLADLWSLDFKNNPTTYNGRGYMLTGSIRTDGFSLQLLALKLKECSSIKYKRLPEDVALPPRMLSVLSGIDDHLTEIRHVPLLQLLDMSRADVKEHGVTTLGIDLGQNCVVGACAVLASEQNRPAEQPPTFINLSVKSRAVYQPSFKKRTWLEAQKGAATGAETITDLELKIPPRRGNDADYIAHVSAKREMSDQLTEFYNSPKMMSRQYDAERAHEGEFSKIADQLLRMVGGTIGRAKDPDAKVVIGIGLGKFGPGFGLTSLDRAFAAYFIRTVSAPTATS